MDLDRARAGGVVARDEGREHGRAERREGRVRRRRARHVREPGGVALRNERVEAAGQKQRFALRAPLTVFPFFSPALLLLAASARSESGLPPPGPPPRRGRAA